MTTEPENASGFTLVEILAVLFIISLLTTMSLPPIITYIRQLEFRSCLRETSQLMRQGQILSKELFLPHRIVQKGKKLLLQCRTASEWTETPYHVSVKPGTEIHLNQNPVFYPSGAIVPLCSVRISHFGRKCQLTVSAAGRIRLKRLD